MSGSPIRAGLVAVSVVTVVAAQSNSNISGPAYTLINARTSQNRSQFFVYDNVDSPFNHGFPSGLFGSSTAAMGKLHVNPSCVYRASAANGCSTDATAIDQIRGTVFQFTFDPMASGEFVGLNFEEPQNWGVRQTGIGYDLTGATQLVFDAISPTGGIQVQFSVNGSTTAYMSIPQTWKTITIPLNSLGLTSLTGIHLLFGIASNGANAPRGGTVLLDNVEFLPVPTSQTTSLGLPLANQVFGIEHVQNSLSGSIQIPPDQTNSNLATLYESSLAVIALANRGQPQDLANAKLIADTLVYSLGHDNQGEPLPAPGGTSALRNGTFAGDIALFNSQGPQGGQQGQVRLSGYTASIECAQTGFCLDLDGATGGNNAFGILGLLAAYKRFQSPTYLNAALTLGNWIYASLLDSGGTGYGGYFLGYPDQGLPKLLQKGKSTENNADIFAAFTALASVENAADNSSAAALWTTRANVAGDFVMQMFDSATSHFFAGTVTSTQAAPGTYPNGTRKGNDIINTFDFLDTETFTTLAMAPASRYRNQIDWHLPVQWAAKHFQSSVTAANVTFQGFDLIQASEHLPTDGPAGIAWEFTGQEVAAMKLVDTLYGTSQFADPVGTYLSQIQQVQAMAPFTDSQGIVASTLQNGDTVAPYQQCLVTPYQCIAERVGLAATIWAIAAEQGLDPLLSTALPARTQTITFGGLSDLVLGTAPFTLSATASSGLPVAFASNTTAVCTVSGAIVTLIAVGACSITASQPGSPDYAAATPVTQSFTVASTSATVLVGAPKASDSYYGMCCNDKTSVAAEFTLTSSEYVTTINVVLLGSSIYDFSLQNSLTGSTTTFASAVITAPTPGSNTESITINATLPAGKYYLVGTEDPASTLVVPGWWVSDGTFVTNAGSVASGVWFGSPGPTGTWVFTSGMANGYTYDAPVFIVNGTQASGLTFQTITFGPLSNVTYGVSPFRVNATAGSGLAVSFASTTPAVCTVAGNTVTIIATGACSITATQAGNASYAAATPVTQSFTVSAATPGSLSVTPATLNFEAWQGSPPQSQSLQIGGSAGTAWQATSSGGAWLSVSPRAGQIPAALTVLVNSGGLTAGTYQGNITIQAPAATPSSSTISVTLTVTASSATSVSFTLYPIPTADSGTFSIANGPDGALWFTEASGNKIGRITKAGAITEYALPTANAYPEGITAGADGAVWFVEYIASKIGRITTAGAITEYAIPTSVGAQPRWITAGSDGALWFTGLSNNIGRITTSGVFTKYLVQTSSGLGDITAGPDQALWFAGEGGIGRITTSGNITEYTTSLGFAANQIRNGPDGALWFTLGPSGIGRITTSGVITTYNNDSYGAITAGPDGSMWYAGFTGSGAAIGQFTLLGAISSYNVPTRNSKSTQGFDITTGPDGALWFADDADNLIGRAALNPASTPSINQGGIVPVYSTVTTIEPDEWVSILGTNLANSTATWNGTFPTSLGGTSVTINGKSAYISYVSPTQINLQAPDDTATGSVAVVVTTASGTATSTVTLAQVGPSFLLLDSKHVAGIILRSNGAGAYGGGTYDIIGPTGDSLGYPTVAPKAGDAIELFSTGIGPTNPAVPAGQAFSGSAPTTNPVTLLINNVSVTPNFAGLTGAGLYQINLTVPAGLGTGDVPLVATVGGVRTPPNVAISLQ